MAKPKPESAAVREKAIELIAEHLLAYGPVNWHLVQNLFPQVSTRTFFRWIEGVKSGKFAPDEMKAEGRRRTRAMMTADLPALPPPQYLAAGGPQAQALLGHPVSYYLWPSLLWTAGLVVVFAPIAVWKLKST